MEMDAAAKREPFAGAAPHAGRNSDRNSFQSILKWLLLLSLTGSIKHELSNIVERSICALCSITSPGVMHHNQTTASNETEVEKPNDGPCECGVPLSLCVCVCLRSVSCRKWKFKPKHINVRSSHNESDGGGKGDRRKRADCVRLSAGNGRTIFERNAPPRRSTLSAASRDADNVEQNR